jgi:hypothetical protein
MFWSRINGDASHPLDARFSGSALSDQPFLEALKP